MGLLDDLTYDPQMALGMGLLSAGGNSRMPASLGQGLGSAWSNMQNTAKAKAKVDLEKLQMQHLQDQMAQAKLMNPLQLQQLQAAIEQQKGQNDFAKSLPDMIERLRGGGPAATPYQDQVTPPMINSTAPAKASSESGPEDFFKNAATIPYPVEKRAAIEAGLRQWPQFRPMIQNPDAANRDPSIALGTMGAVAGAAGYKGGDQIMKLAELMKPQFAPEGTTIINPVSQKREYIAKMETGMRPTANEGVEAIPGMMQFLQDKTNATVSPIDAAKFKYETGRDIGGTQPPSGNGMSPKDSASVRTAATTGANEDWLKNSYRPTLDAAKSADNMLTNVQALRSIDMNTGWGTEAKAGAASVLAGLGIAPKNAEMFAANSQKFQSQAMTRLWEVLNTAKGPQTEGDADRAKATFASLKNTPEANAFIIDLAEANARRDKIRAAFYSEAMPVARDAGDMTAVDRKWMQIQRSVWDDPIMAKWKKK